MKYGTSAPFADVNLIGGYAPIIVQNVEKSQTIKIKNYVFTRTRIYCTVSWSY